MKKPADGKYLRSLCADGVFRILTWIPTPDDQPTGLAVYDALPLSPHLIKEWLDRKPWTQEKEDRFRGVDGRSVPREQWLNPPTGVLPNLGSKNELDEEKSVLLEEAKREDERRKERGDGKERFVCGSVESDYDLSPR